jgi:hypothetical protein
MEDAMITPGAARWRTLGVWRHFPKYEYDVVLHRGSRNLGRVLSGRVRA